MLSASYFEDQGYTHVRQLPDGSWAGLIPLLFTTGLCLGMDELTYQRRFCYKKREDAIAALAGLQAVTDEPTGWVARRPEIVAGDCINSPRNAARPTQNAPRATAHR